MLGWLNAITFQNGDVPMVNDAGWNIAPTTGQLRKKAVGLGIRPSSGSLQNAAKDTGYRKLPFPATNLLLTWVRLVPITSPVMLTPIPSRLCCMWITNP
jgi:hypothetical protein